MTTHFITAELDLAPQSQPLVEAIEAQLAKQGQPLRWAVVAVDRNTQKATVEAVITKP